MYRIASLVSLCDQKTLDFLCRNDHKDLGVLALTPPKFLRALARALSDVEIQTSTMFHLILVERV